MSVFTTPRRTPLSASAATGARHSGSGGESSGRRVVRSALEMLMDTTSPELVGLRSPPGGSSVTRPAATPASSFSVTYTNAPAATPALSQAHSTVCSALASAPSAAGTAASAGAASATVVRSCAEPSALCFLSPHGKDALGSLSQVRRTAKSRRTHGHRGRQPTSAGGTTLRPPAKQPPRPQQSREGVLSDKGDVEDHEADSGIDGESYRTLAPVSPSRSLYADVEAARKPPPHAAKTSLMDSYSPTPVSSAPQSAVKSNRHDSSAAEGEMARDDGDESGTTALVTHAEMEHVVAAALRRYEKERDAEEEAVLQQVSKEVEEQASRYADLVEAYNTVRADKAALQKKLTEAAGECEELRHALQKARQTQQEQKDSMKRLEVELYHVRDAQQQQQQEQHRMLVKAEGADWELQRARYQKRQDTLETQLHQAREALREMEARVAEQEDELAALRERSAKASAETEVEYADIHLRMRQLAQNMASMEGALRERDATITEQAARLRETSDRQEAELRALTAEREKAETALAGARDALQRQTDDIRRRMHRVTELQQQRGALKDEVKAARHALQAASEDQERVLRSLEKVLFTVKQRLFSAADGAGRVRQPPSVHSTRGPHNFPLNRRSNHVDSTLVYEDDDDENADELLSCTAISQSHSRSGSANRTLELSCSEEDDDGEAGRLSLPAAVSAKEEHCSAASPKPCTHRTSPSSSAAVASQRRARTLSPPQTVRAATREARANCAKSSTTASTISHEMRHYSSQALILLRELHRCLLSVTSQNRKSLPWRDIAPAGTRGSADRSGATVAKLEQACRYLKSELDSAQTALKGAQAECQWRTLSIKKLEEDVQAARREVLAAEKQRLACEAQMETDALVREELEAQLTELKATCATATARQKASEDALAEAKAAAERSAALAEEVGQLKDAAESALAKEQSKGARQATALRNHAEAQAALTDELEKLKEKHKGSLAQLQTYHTREAAQLLKQQREGGNARGTATEAWKTERVSLEAQISSLELKLRASTEATTAAQRRCATLEEHLALHVGIEKTTLKTIVSIAHTPLVPLSVDTADAGEGSCTTHSHSAVLFTEKQLFGGDDETPEVEVGATPSRKGVKDVASAVSLTRTTTGRTTALSVVSARLPTVDATPPNVTSSTAVSLESPALPPHLGGASLETEKSSAVAALAPLRQHTVAAVQQLALEVVRLRQGAVLSSVKSPVITQPRTTTRQPRSVISAEGWYGGATALNGVNGDVPVQSFQSRGSDGDMKQPATATPCSPPPLEAPLALQPPPQFQSQHQPPRTPHREHPSAGSVPQTRTLGEVPLSSQHRSRSQSGNSPAPSHPSPSVTTGTPSGCCAPPVFAATTASVGEHIYNVSPWSRSLPPRSLSSSSPQVSHPAVAAYDKLWNGSRRSASLKDGLSGSSYSTGRGSVDGSCSPARPPSLRALSLPR
ncbi:hypothetical protein, conserved [Leishmania tarentolae]|uniref:Uncharacterized protein n=1 Tax=Leishmania tarentolae TaxID=5689 RepID=A0A640K7S8_LEITA|nr:hypothetical protein, conserved [Leishmania tarentolae]